MCFRSRVQSSGWAQPPSTKELFQIIFTHMMNREIILSKKREFDSVLYNLWPLLTPWVAASRLLATPARLKQKGVAGHWLVQHTAPVRAEPDGRPHLHREWYKYPTSCSYISSSTLHITHTLAHTYQYPSSPWASALDHYKVSELKSRVGRTSVRNNKRTYECYIH